MFIHIKIIGITTTFLIGCAKETPPNNGSNHSTSGYMEETELELESEPEQETDNDIMKDIGDHEETVEMNGNVRFRLFQDGEEIYKFPAGFNEGNAHYNESFVNVEAVSFQDYNDDGLTDIIILNSYTYINGQNIEKVYNQPRIYLRKEGAHEFYRDGFIEEYLIKQRYNDSIASIMSSKEEYKEYVASFY